jgi:hypothetical protein
MARKTGNKSDRFSDGNRPLYEPLPETACQIFDMMYDLCVAATAGRDAFKGMVRKHGIKSRTGLYYRMEELRTYVLYSRNYRNRKEASQNWERYLKEESARHEENTVTIDGKLYYRTVSDDGKEWLHRLYLKDGSDEVQDEMLAAQHEAKEPEELKLDGSGKERGKKNAKTKQV